MPEQTDQTPGTSAEFVPIASIIVEERQRKNYDPMALTELANSIRERGLIHALVVRPDGKTLITGGRRLKVLSDPMRNLSAGLTYVGNPVPQGMVPVIRATSEDPLEWEELELDENIRRKDLTWQELAETTARLEAVRKARRESALTQIENSPDPYLAGIEAPPQVTNASLAIETRGTDSPAAVTAVRQELIVARHLDDPEVRAAPDLKSAMKVLKKKDEARNLLALGAMVGKTFSAELHKVYNVNCLEWMAAEAAKPDGARFDIILTDPPYGMGAHEFGDGAGRLEGIEHHYDDSYEAWKLLMDGPHGWCNLSHQIAKPEAHAYVFCDFDRFHELKAMMQSAGWYVFRTPLINVKTNSGRVPLPDQGPRRQYEICLYAIKGKKRVNSIKSDVIVTEADEQLSHGAQKPVALYSELLSRSVKPGDHVLDSFGGTGTLLPAAHEAKAIATVLEQNPTYYGLCVERAQALGQQKELSL